MLSCLIQNLNFFNLLFFNFIIFSLYKHVIFFYNTSIIFYAYFYNNLVKYWLLELILPLKTFYVTNLYYSLLFWLYYLKNLMFKKTILFNQPQLVPILQYNLINTPVSLQYNSNLKRYLNQNLIYILLFFTAFFWFVPILNYNFNYNFNLIMRNFTLYKFFNTYFFQIYYL